MLARQVLQNNCPALAAEVIILLLGEYLGYLPDRGEEVIGSKDLKLILSFLHGSPLNASPLNYLKILCPFHARTVGGILRSEWFLTQGS